jgi:hypothetical protein
MAEATNKRICEVLRRVQEDVSGVRHDMRGLREEVTAMRGHRLAIQRDVNNTYERLATPEVRADRIERRLEPSDAPA